MAKFVPDLNLAQLCELRVKLIRARANNVREVTDQNGESLTYKSDREMAAALAYIESLIAAKRSGTTANVIKFRTSKGT
jgi:hypothetical protein